jgi:hypothetical protein
MKAQRALLGLIVLLVPAVASAQRYAPSNGYPPMMPGGFQDRAGLPMWGASLGLGAMQIDNQDVTCSNCDYSPIAGEVDAHIGGMLNARFGLMLELQDNAKTVSDNGANGAESLSQFAAMAAGQYWVTPKIWIKGGIGLAHLSDDFETYYGTGSQPVDNGAALMAGAGIELLQSRTFSIDLSARMISAGYDGIQKELTSGTIDVGVNWFGFGGGSTVIVVR